jgi:hypothetical protein
VKFAVDNLGHQVVWELDEVLVRGGTIERRHPRHRLHDTSSSNPPKSGGFALSEAGNGESKGCKGNADQWLGKHPRKTA